MEAKKIKLRSGQVEINYWEAGEGEISLLFLHGWCIDAKYWDSQLVFCSDKYKVYAVDLPGFGESRAQRKDWTIREYALDIHAFIKTLGLSKVILVGHSMSGEIVLETALQDNSSILGVIGVDNFKFIDVEFSSEQLAQFQSFFSKLESDFQAYAPIYADAMLFHPATPEVVKERVRNDFAAAKPDSSYAIFTNLMQYTRTVPEKLEKLPYKLFLINTDLPPTNEVGLQDHCKHGFSISTLSDTGHYPMIEKPAEFNRLLESVLSLLLE